MSRLYIAVLILLILNVGDAACQESAPDSLAAGSFQLSRTLDNGMQVVVRSMPEAALVRVEVFYAAGSAVEPDSLAGLAHFSEHLLMQSSPHHPDGELRRKLTLYSTYSNAHTGSAYMLFDTECLPDFLPEILALEADRLLPPTVAADRFALVKSVVLQELALRKRLPPTEEFLESVFHACYAGHPFGRGIGGTEATVKSLEIDDFLQFHQQYIRPERSALVIKGPVDPERTLAEIERIFGSGPPHETVFQETPAYPPVAASQFITDSQDHIGLKLCLAFRIPPQEDLDVALLAVLPHIMEESGFYPHIWGVPGENVVMLSSSYLYNRPSTNNEDHWFRIYYEFDPEQQCLRSMGYQWEDISEMVREMGNADEFQKRIENALGKLERSDRNPGMSTSQGSALVNGNQYLTRDRIRAVLADVGPADFQRFMERWINPDRAVVGISHGRDSERPATISMAKAVRTKASGGAGPHQEGLTRAEIEPVLAAYGQSDLIQLSRFELENGIPVYSLLIPEADRWAMAGFRIFNGIKDMRPEKKPGLTRIFNLVINYDPQQKRDPDRDLPPRRLPYDLEFDLGWNTAGFFVQGSVEKIDRIITAVDKRVKSGEFNSIRWYAVTRWGEDYFRDTRNKKIFVARAWRTEQLFGPDHPSLGMWAPDPDAFIKIKYKDLANLHKDYIKKTGNLVLMVAGPAGEEDVEPALNRTFGQYDSWKPGEPDAFPGKPIQGIGGKVIPDLTRGDVMLEISFPLVPPAIGPRSSITALALESALDQALTDRLREQEGLTYGVQASVSPAPGHQMWVISVTCQPGQGPTVLSFTREELARIVDSGLGADEIARARLDLAGRFIRNFSDRKSGLNDLRRLAEFGDVPLQPLREIALVTAEDVNALAWSAIDPRNFVFTVTGPLFEEDIERFQIP